MATKGKKISEVALENKLAELDGSELVPMAKNGSNAVADTDTIKKFAQDGLAKASDVPTKVSELENDAKYQTESDVDGKLTDKVDKEAGKVLSSNDFTDEDKAKLDRFELVLATDDEIEDGLHQIASSEDYRSKLKENGYVVYHDVKYKVKDCGVTSDSFPWIVTEGAVITANDEGELNDHTQENVVRSVYIWFDTILHYQPYNTFIPSKVSELQNDAKYQDEGHVSAQIKVAINAHEVAMEERLVTIESKVEDLNASKVGKVDGKGLSSNDYTDTDKAKLDGIAANAQVNVLEGVKVNGVALAIASKIVNILIATGTDNGTISVQNVNVPVKGLAAMAYKANVSESDLTTALKKVIDDKAENADLTALSGKIDVLNGTGTGSVSKAITDAFNDFATKVSDDGVVNSYKELIDWAAEHGADATELAASIQRIDGLLDGIGGTGEPMDVKTAIANAISDLNIGNYYTKAQTDTLLAKKVDKVTGKGLSTNDYTTDEKNKLGALPTNSELTTTLATKADKTTVNTELAKKADKTAIADMLTKTEASDTYQPKGNYLTSHQSLADYAKTATMNTELAKKVDKVSGKQLSTEDFTTLLKQKLEGLTNYDDSTLTSELNALKSRLDTLVGSGDVTAVIDTFQEIEAFLQGVTNTQTLTGLLQEMKSEIVALCASTYIAKPSNGTSSQFLKADGSVDSTAYLPTSGGELNQGKTITLKSGGNPTGGGSSCGFNFKDANDNVVAKFGIYSQNNEFRYAYIGWGESPYSQNSNLSVSDTIFNYKNNKVWHAGNDGAGSGLDADLLDGVEGANFSYVRNSLNFKGGVITEQSYTTEQFLNRLAEIGAFRRRSFNFKCSWSYSNNGWINDVDCGNILIAGAWIEVFTDNPTTDTATIPDNFYVRITTATIANAESKAINNAIFVYTNNGEEYKPGWRRYITSKQEAASADKLTTKQLTNENLNDIKSNGKNYNIYYAKSNNTCTNVPAGLTIGFVLFVFGGDNVNFAIQQLIDNANGNAYKRTLVNNVWSAWQQIATIDGAVAKLTTKQLTNEDLNDIKDSEFRCYYGDGNNTCANKPSGMTSFNLTVYRTTPTSGVQIINTATAGSHKRGWTSQGWSAWKKMLTEDDIASLVSRIEALETRPTIASVDSLPSTPNNNTLYAIPE